ncbi:MAG: pre-peptidase C-terminal domain-containing protein [Sphingomonadaceae bacterium]|nr:pre-peptidase C-terminal domain-containing protein [Sphingomonadaceae bacterium]
MAKKTLPDQINLATSADVMRAGVGEPTMSTSTASRGGPAPGDIHDLIYFGEPMEGTANDDFIAAVPSLAAGNTMNGNAADDILLGDAPDFWFATAGNPNNAIGSAFNLDSSGIWSTSFNPLVGVAESVVPHTTVHVDATAGQTEFFSVTLAAGDVITVDIDFGHNDFYGDSTDVVVELYDAGGALLASDDDGASIDEGGLGSVSTFDSYLTFTVGAAGTYYIRAREFGGDPLFEGGEQFLMHVSATTHAATGTLTSGNDTMNGGANNDVLMGSFGTDVLNGDTENDTLYGGYDIDSVNGGDGDDRIGILDGEFIDNVDGGLGVDTLDLSNIQGVSEAVNIDLGAGTFTGLGGSTTIASIESVLGTQRDDTLDAGGIGGVTLDGGLGDDQINGYINNQTLLGGLGDDTIFADDSFVTGVGDNIDGGAGNDSLIGAGGADTITGGADNDSVDAGDADDSIDGGFGFDTLLGGLGNDTIFADVTLASAEADSIIGAGGDDSLTGATANDTLQGGAGFDALFGREGHDLMLGAGDNDTLDGDNGLDSLDGGNGSDSLLGGGGSDTLQGGGDADTLDGGGAIDFADYSAASAKVIADLKTPGNNTNAALGDVYINIENLRGTALRDKLAGDDLANRLEGLAENDQLNGRNGADTLVGGGGKDRLKGGEDADQFVLDDISLKDKIIDFESGIDEIALDGGVFGLPPGALAPSRFVIGTAAGDANDRIIYDAIKGKLYFDADGNGAGAKVLIATLGGDPPLAASDFIVI